jgi:hypothetical protein
MLVTGEQLKHDSGTKCVNDFNFRYYLALCEMIEWLCMNGKDGVGNNKSLLEDTVNNGNLLQTRSGTQSHAHSVIIIFT